jgi:hypothetical protein
MPIPARASPADVYERPLAANGFAENELDTVSLERTVELPVVGERDVTITNHVRAYGPESNESAGENVTPAVMFLVSTPQAKVAGQGTNPLGRVPLEELVSRVASRGEGFDDMEKVGSRTIESLGTETTVEKYVTTATFEDESVETFVYVTRIPHGDDYVIAVAVLPKEFDEDEETLYELMRNVDHDDGED